MKNGSHGNRTLSYRPCNPLASVSKLLFCWKQADMEIAGDNDQQQYKDNFLEMMVLWLQQGQAGKNKKKTVAQAVKAENFPQNIYVNDGYHQP